MTEALLGIMKSPPDLCIKIKFFKVLAYWTACFFQLALTFSQTTSVACGAFGEGLTVFARSSESGCRVF